MFYSLSQAAAWRKAGWAREQFGTRPFIRDWKCQKRSSHFSSLLALSSERDLIRDWWRFWLMAMWKEIQRALYTAIEMPFVQPAPQRSHSLYVAEHGLASMVHIAIHKTTAWPILADIHVMCSSFISCPCMNFISLFPSLILSFLPISLPSKVFSHVVEAKKNLSILSLFGLSHWKKRWKHFVLTKVSSPNEIWKQVPRIAVCTLKRIKNAEM